MMALLLLVCAAAPPTNRDPSLPDGAITFMATPAGYAQHPVHSLAFWPDGKVLVAGSSAGVRFYHLPTQRWQRFVPAPRNRRGTTEVLLDEQGSTALFGFTDGGFWGRRPVTDWDVRGTLHAYDLRRSHALPVIKTEGRQWALVLSADGSTIARTESDFEKFTVRVWESASGREKARFTIASRAPSSAVLALSPDGKLLAVVLEDRKEGVVYSGLVRTATCREVKSLGAFPTMCVAFSRDGKALAVVRKGVISLHNGLSGQPVKDILINGVRADQAAFSPDGRVLALISKYWEGKSLKLVELTSGMVRLERGVEYQFASTALAFSPRGGILATDGGDGRPILWDLTGRYSLRGGATRDTLVGLYSRSGEQGGKAIGEILRSPREAVTFLRKGVPATKAPLDDEKIKQLIALADDRDPAIAARAKAALIEAGYRALSPLRVARHEAKDKSRREGLERLIEEAGHPVARRLLRDLRAVEALELLLTPEARKLLREWAAKGWPASELTEAARAALDRLDKHR